MLGREIMGFAWIVDLLGVLPSSRGVSIRVIGLIRGPLYLPSAR